MDPALLKERESFEKRALRTPSVQKKKERKSDSTPRDEPKTKSPKIAELNPFKASTGSSQYRFAVLAKIVKHMKTRHLQGDMHPLTLEEILDETHQLDVSVKIKQWLATEALLNNPKIEVIPGNKFVFKAMYKIRDRKSLLRLLKRQDIKGLGGILVEDIEESMPHSEKALKTLLNQNEIICIQRPLDKKKIVFYNDRAGVSPIDEEFKKLWRSIAVDSLDESKIEEYLEKQGIRAMQDHGPKKPIAPIKRKISAPRAKKSRDNKHLANILETYDDNTLTTEGQFAQKQ